MKIDFWRAVGTIFIGSLVVGYLDTIFVFPVLETNLMAGALLETFYIVICTAILTYIYFMGASVKPSLKTGLSYGLLTLAAPFVIGFMDGLTGMPAPDLATYSSYYGSYFGLIVILEIAAMLIVSVVIGKLLEKTHKTHGHHEHSS